MFNVRTFLLKLFIPLLLSVILFTACQNEESSLELTEKTYTTAALQECKDDICPKIDIQLLQARGNSELAHTVNNAVQKAMAASLGMSPDDEPKIKTIDDGITNFIDSYRTSSTEFPGMAESYEITTSSSVTHNSSTLLSVKMDTYSYWGGAHGYSSTSYLNFDKETAQELNIARLIKEKQKFTMLAEEKFREQQDIPSDGNINETGYFFENDTFSLPENIGFEGDDLVLVYNPYEVAAYAEGQIIIKIPKAAAAPFLSVRL